MSVQGHLLDITVIGCTKLKDTAWLSRQDPYVILEYGLHKHRTRTHTDGGRDPIFNDQYMLSLVENLQEINVDVWNSNMIKKDDFIGSGKILLQRVLTEGFHDSTWPLTTRSGKRAGEIRVILRYTNHAHHKPPPYAAPSAYPTQGHGGYPPGYAPYPPPGQSPYDPRAYPPQNPHGAQPYPPQPYPPQGGYPPYPTHYGAPPYHPYPPYPPYPPY